MAKINPIKVKADADKLEKAGKLEQAIALYNQLVDDNPRDWNTIKKIGDLYARLNKNREAIEAYARVAEFYAKDGFLLKAIAIWKQINKLDPSALDSYVSLADLYAKQGLMMEAKSQYQIVVDEYIKRGKTRDAGEVLRKMAEIDPGDLKVRSKLADLYMREGNIQRAVGEHVAIAEELTKKGHLAEALQVLEKGLKLDARSNRIRLELARIHLVQKNYERASQYLEEAVQGAPNDGQTLAKLGEAYLGAKKIEEAEAIFKRLLELDPNDQESRVQMGRVYLLQGQLDRAFDEFVPVIDRLLERKEGDRAAALLQQVLQASSSHVKSLVKLVEVYRVLQMDNAVVSAYSQLTEAYVNAGQMDQAAAVLEILVSMEPQNQQHKTKLQFVKGRLEGGGGPFAPAAEEEEIEEEFDLGTDEPPPFVPEAAGAAGPARSAPTATIYRAAPPSAPTRPAIEASGPLSDQDREFIEEHLAEGRVFRKYGLLDKAADQFESVVARFPDHVEARLELKDLYREKGDSPRAAQQCQALAEIARLRGDAAAARDYDEQARALGAPVEAAREAASARTAPASAARPAAGRAAASQEEEIALPEAEEEIPLEVEEGGFEPEPAGAAAGSGAALPSLDFGGDGEDLSGHFVEEDVQTAAEQEVEVPFEPEPSASRLEVESASDELPVIEEEEPPVLSFEAEAEPAPAAQPEAEAGMSLDFSEEDLTLEEPAAEPPPSRPAPAPPPLPAPSPPAPLKAARPAPRPSAAPAPAPPAPASRPAARPTPTAPAVPADLQRVLDEVDSYISLGFVEDAKDAVREVGARYPGHPALLEKIAELGLDQEVVEEPALPLEPASPPLDPFADESPLADALGDLGLPEPSLDTGFPAPALPELDEPALPEPDLPGVEAEEELSLPGSEPQPALVAEDTGGIDLGTELGELFGTQSAVEDSSLQAISVELGDTGLADIFKEFKKGVDKQLGQEDYDTRYNLGIAYKEMGLIDEAIAEFQLAAKDQRRLLECASMLGICFMEKGMPKLAIKWFEKGLKAPGRSDEEYQGLRYDLAMAYEASGETSRALNLYTELYGQDANFRDVASKVRELRSALG